MKVSSLGIGLIRGFEGLITHAYKAHPSEKYFTIGYGHYGPDVQPNDVCTEEMAERLLQSDVNAFAVKVVKVLNADEIEVNQNQFDALVSFAFNVGINALVNSTLWRLLRDKDYLGAASQFKRWNKCNGIVLNGLTRRREAEAKLFLS